MGLANWIARRNGFVKPEEVKTAKRSFNAAQVGRLTNSWTTQPKPIDADIRAGLRKLRARTREQAQNNDYVRRFLALTKSNVIGSQGVILQARSVDPNGKPDKLANAAIEESWTEWGVKGSPDVTGGHSWRSMQNLMIETVAKDGEALVVMHHGWKHNEASFALEFIDVEALDVEHNRDLGNGNTIQMGVELNQYRRPVAYHVLTGATTDDHYSYNGRKYRRIPADRVLHLFLPESVWQTRGFPWMASSLMRLNMLAGYEEAELVAARVASSKMGFFESEGGEEYVGDDTDSDGNVITDAEPGAMEVLPPGMKFTAWDPSHPSTAFEGFVKTNLRGISAGLGVSYHTLANDLEGVNYSSGRLGALEDREAWKLLQGWVIESFCMPVYKEWLRMSLLSGSITVAGRPLRSARYDKFKRVTWQPKRWAWVDPQKEMKGHGEALDRKLKSPQQVMGEMGLNVDEVLDDWVIWREKLKERGLPEPAEAGFFTPEENENENENENEVSSNATKDD